MMIDYLLIAMGIAIALIIGALVWLARAYLRLKRDYQVLANTVQGNTQDIAGLCSAALTVDSRVMSNDKQLSDLLTQLAERQQNDQHQQNDQSAHPYSGILHEVRSGASVNELMRNYGLSHDEAALLIRLHGSEN
jgi:type II secretory pathway component PulF